MSRNNNIDEAIQAFLEKGGEITQLKYADQKLQNKARRMAFHKDKAMNGSEKSKTFLENERTRESGMIFSRDERMKK